VDTFVVLPDDDIDERAFQFDHGCEYVMRCARCLFVSAPPKGCCRNDAVDQTEL
jgi:uncharacterized OB-fold protein